MACGTSVRILDELAALVGMFGQNLSGPADQPGRGLVARPGHHVHVEQQLVAGQLANCAGLILELDVEQFGHDVVGRVVFAPVDVLREDLAGVEALGRDGHRLAGLGAHRFVGVVPDGLLVLLRDAEQHADHPHRHLRPKIFDEVEAPCADDRVEAAGAELAGLVFECIDLAGSEHPGQQFAVDVVEGRVLEDQDARRHLHARPDQLEDGATRGAEGLVVHQGFVDIGEAADRVEVVLRVVVQRLLFTQTREHGVGVGVELDVVRVEVDFILRTGCHGVASRRPTVA